MRPGAIRPGPGAGAPPPRAARPAPVSAAPARTSFRKVVLWVALAHLLLLAIVGFWRFPSKAPASGQVMDFIALPSQQVSPTPPPSGSAPQAPTPPAAAPPAPTPVTPPPPTPVTPPTPVEPTPTPPTPVADSEPPAPSPVPAAPSEIVIPQKPTPPAPETAAKSEKAEKKKKKKAKTSATAAPDDTEDEATPDKPAPHVPKVNLQEVDRSAVAPAAAKGVADGKGTKPNESKSPEGEGNGLTAAGVKDALAKRLNGQGLDGHLVGPASGGGGPAGTGDQWYYDLIRQAMYGAWAQPSEFAGQHLNTKIKIHIAADGTVSDPSIAVSSGNAAYDASALDAARNVTRLSKPRPDAIPEAVSVNFQLME